MNMRSVVANWMSGGGDGGYGYGRDIPRYAYGTRRDQIRPISASVRPVMLWWPPRGVCCRQTIALQHVETGRSTPLATHHFVPTRYHTTIGSHDPVLHIAAGDTVRTTTVDAAGRDAHGAQITPGGNRRATSSSR